MFINAPPGILFAGDPGFVQKNNGANAAKPGADVWNAYWKNVNVGKISGGCETAEGEKRSNCGSPKRRYANVARME